MNYDVNDYFNMSTKEKYDYNKKESLKFANSMVKYDLKRVYRERLHLIVALMTEAFGTVALGALAYCTHSVTQFCLTVGAAGVTLVSSFMFYPEFKASSEELRRIREKRDDIVRDQMQVGCDVGLYDEGNVVSFKRIRK